MAITRRDLGAGLAGLSVSLAGGGAIAAASPKPRKLDAIVLGAGMSGLNTAWLLEQQGLNVLVLEARGRVGGRVLTLFDQPGHPEMGFNSMGAGYGRGIDAAKRAGVELQDVAPRFMKSPQDLVLGGRMLSREDWAKSPSNPFPAALKQMMPWEIVPRLIAEKNPLKDWADWLDPSSAPLDVSMYDFLKAQGLSDPAIHLAFDTSPYYGVSSYGVSALMFEFNQAWGKAQATAGPQSYAVKGGNQNLPIAMAKLLKGDLLFNKEVVGIVTDAGVATVTCRDGSSYSAGRVVCSLPFSTLRHVHIEPGLTGVQARAVQMLPYQPISIAFLQVKAPFWEVDHHSPALWTDGPLGIIIAQRFDDNDPDKVTGLMVQARGEMAGYWDRMGKDAALRMIVSELETVRPAAKGKVVGAALHSWGQERFNAGDWAYFAPGQISSIVKDMATAAGRLHFCGEHTAVANRGLEGALESSERVALEVTTA